jgi:hypothetical protein
MSSQKRLQFVAVNCGPAPGPECPFTMNRTVADSHKTRINAQDQVIRHYQAPDTKTGFQGDWCGEGVNCSKGKITVDLGLCPRAWQNYHVTVCEAKRQS